ncbi:hypothetical protein AYO44_03465 [Planctomycetaceae bacterium SCGC AG-212-F19]|nr:hypothetical protein AYO44_03465 [Planctomycetaceae bacterium SCGC AG-212-F19]
MPIHDWTRVRPNRFHDFHQSWTIAIRNALNSGRLPPGYFAMVEQHAGGPEPDVITLDLAGPARSSPGGIAVESQPPKARFIARSESGIYARKANRITVRHPDGVVVAVIEIVSPGNKDSRHAIHAFARKAVALICAGVHLLIVDVFPPGRRDPQGIHKVIWDRLCDEPFTLPPDKPLTLAAYTAGTEMVAYVEPVAVGDALPDMPVFLTADRYVPCPLEATYQTAWEQFPTPLKGPLETPPKP